MIKLSNHSKDLFLECRRKYKLSRKWEAREKNYNLAVGLLVHAGLAMWHLSHDEVAAALAVVEEAKTFEIESKEEVVDYALIHLNEYFAEYKNDQAIQMITAETEFMVPVADGILYRGRLDGLCMYQGVMRVNETKTTSLQPGNYWKQFEHHPQSIGYAVVAEILYEVKVDSVVIDAIFKMTKQRKDPSFDRKIFAISNAMKMEWQLEILQIAEDLKRAEETDTFYPNWSACHGKYGSCEFFDFCSNNQNIDVLKSSHKRKNERGGVSEDP